MNSNENLSKIKGHETRKVPDVHCQYLGLLNDPKTIFNFPSLGNLCYRCRPPSVPLLEHQLSTCLTKSFTKCTVYSSEKGNKLPKNLSELANYKATNRKLPWIIGGTAIIALISVVILLNQNKPVTKPEFNNVDSSTLVQETLTDESSQSMTPNQEGLVTATNTEIAPNVTAEATQTAATEVTHKLDTPIGGEQKFIIHQVLDGESIEQYAIQYNTSKDAIIDVNYFLPIPLWINWLIIIPVDLMDTVNLPTFEAYVVIDEMITVEQLAEKLAIDVTELGFYNGIESDYVLKSGNWLLIPREGYFYYN